MCIFKDICTHDEGEESNAYKVITTKKGKQLSGLLEVHH